jgi:error-prone DNA polymerase
MSWSGATWPNASARELVGFRLLAVDGKWERVDGVEHLIASRLHDMTSLLGMLETR